MGNLEKSISSADRLICMMKNELHNNGIEPADPPAHSCKQNIITTTPFIITITLPLNHT